MTGSTRLRASLWVWLGVFIAVGVFGAWVTTSISPAKYTATATDFVSTGTTDDQLQSLAATIYVQSRMTSYAQLATSDVVLARTIGDLGLRTTPAQLAPSITATARTGSLLIDISATARTPAAAKTLDREIADNLRDVIETTIEEDTVAGTALVHIQVVNAATASRVPSYPNLPVLLTSGGLIGGILWLGIVMILNRLTARLTTATDVSVVTDLPILSRIERSSTSFRLAVAIQANPGGSFAESVRQLRTNLAFTGSGTNPIVITSSIPNEGKTTIAINLALAMALAGERVLLIDADLRRPAIANLLNVDGRTGLTNVLRRGMQLEHVVQTWGVDSPFALLTSGSVPPNPSELVGSVAMHTLLVDVSKAYDRVIIDAPPVLAGPDAAILAAETGAAILVVGMARITQEQLRRSIDELGEVGCRPLGLVLNQLANAADFEPVSRAEVNA